MALIRNTRPISGRSKSRIEETLTRSLPSGCAGLVFGALVTVAFGIPAWMFFGGPYLQTRAARGWATAPCTVVSSRNVQLLGRRPVTTFKVLFRYSVNGEHYTSDRYSFWMEQTSILYGRKVLLALPTTNAAGTQSNCFVDPANPSVAVLNRSLPPNFTPAALMLSLPLAFGVLSLVGGIAAVLRGRKT